MNVKALLLIAPEPTHKNMEATTIPGKPAPISATLTAPTQTFRYDTMPV